MNFNLEDITWLAQSIELYPKKEMEYRYYDFNKYYNEIKRKILCINENIVDKMFNDPSNDASSYKAIMNYVKEVTLELNHVERRVWEICLWHFHNIWFDSLDYESKRKWIIEDNGLSPVFINKEEYNQKLLNAIKNDEDREQIESELSDYNRKYMSEWEKKLENYYCNWGKYANIFYWKTEKDDSFLTIDDITMNSVQKDFFDSLLKKYPNYKIMRLDDTLIWSGHFKWIKTNDRFMFYVPKE